MFVKITNEQVENLYYSVEEIRKENPDLPIPKNIRDEDLKEYGFFRVVEPPAPDYNFRTHRLVTQRPELIDGVWTMLRLPVPKNQAEIDNDNIQKMAGVRSQRNKLLSNSDWTQVADAPVDKAAWAVYRQALRDVPAQDGFPWEVVWPDAPV